MSNCAQCNKELVNKNKKAKYCDYLCANHYHNSKRVKRIKG